MPVDATHPCYDENAPKWIRMRHVLGGEDSVKGAAETYLPKLTSQQPEEFKAYVSRAQFFNATSRTRDAFSGMIFRKAPAVKSPSALDALIRDCDLGGQSFDAYQKAATDEVIGVSRFGTLIEWSEGESRPYVVGYKAEQIINWKSVRIAGRVMLALLVLKEQVDPTAPLTGLTAAATESTASEPKGLVDHGATTGAGPALGSGTRGNASAPDDYAHSCVEQIRVYRITETAGTETESRDGQNIPVPVMGVICEIWRRDPEDKDKQWKLQGMITPLRKGKPLPEIPFVFHGPRDSSTEIERPPLEDIALVNLSHYRSSADLEHGRHFTGLPTPWVAGFPEKTELYIGSTRAWVATDPNAKAGFLEFQGQGLSALKEALEQKESQMSVLGARMLEQAKKAAEAADTLKIRSSGEGSVLANIAASLSQSFTLILKWAIWWQSAADKKLSEIGDEVSVKLNTDFDALKLDAQTIVSLVKAWQAGAISQSSLVYVLKQGEMIHPDRSPEDEIDLSQTERAPAPPSPAGGKTKT